MKNHCFPFMGAALTMLALPSMVEAKEQERPNILWLTFEDTSANEFACYGNPYTNTPNVDRLAKEGVQFMQAWSVAPQSSPARSSLITGSYATSFGMDVHPVPNPTPDHIFFPNYLRDAGYYCTNNSKTHYNTTVDNKSMWDECTAQATYNSEKRGENQPFFAVFNTVTSHMGRIRTYHTDGRRDYTKEGIYTDKLSLPAHLPNLPEIRSDYAAHLEAVQDVDTWVGFFLKDLEEKGLADNTIIFVFSDHGGCLPRGKGYVFDTGLRVPLVAYFPEKWKSLAGETGIQNTELVNFTDLGPTVLSLAGVKTPKFMHGKPLFGKYASKEKRAYHFGFGANQLHHYMPNRTVTDGRFKYIRSYIPYRQYGLRNYYQWGMPSNKAWDQFVLDGHNTDELLAQPFGHHRTEMLFDLESDPSELHDLSTSAAHQEIMAEMREQMSNHIRGVKDLGFFLPSSRQEAVLYDRVRKEKYDLNALYALVEAAGNPQQGDLNLFVKSLESDKNEYRFWASVGLAQMAHLGLLETAPTALLPLIDDADPYVSAEAAYAMAYLGHADQAIRHMVYPKSEQTRNAGYSVLECITLDKAMLPLVAKHVDQIRQDAETLPCLQNEDSGLMARGILVNLGEMPIREMHGPDSYQRGLDFNQGRRKMIPLPNPPAKTAKAKK